MTDVPELNRMTGFIREDHVEVIFSYGSGEKTIVQIPFARVAVVIAGFVGLARQMPEGPEKQEALTFVQQANPLPRS